MSILVQETQAGMKIQRGQDQCGKNVYPMPPDTGTIV